MKLRFLMLREWRQRPVRAILTVCSVAFAVAVVFGSSLAASMVRRAYAVASSALDGPPSVDLQAAGGGRFALDAVPRLNDLNGVKESVPMLLQGTWAHFQGKRWQTMIVGLDDVSSPAWSRFKLIDGRLPKRGSEALVDAGVAASLHLKPQQEIVVLARRGVTKLTVVGTVPSASLREYGAGTTVVVPLAFVQKNSWPQAKLTKFAS